MSCEHLLLDQITETYLKGLSDFAGFECITCFAYFEIEVN